VSGTVSIATMHQASLPGFDPVAEAVATQASAGVEERGAVFTRREVVEFILDLAGYTVDKPLHEKRLLEPSFGHGDFLLVAVERLLAATRAHAPRTVPSVDGLRDCIRAVELHTDSFQETRDRVAACLVDHGMAGWEAEVLLDNWLIQGDFLLEPLPFTFTHAVGNPPYVRQERVPEPLLAEYRRRFATLFDRADLYVPFLEKSLGHLEPGGVLAFICSDRWMKNRYGGPLRQLVAQQFHLRYYVDMVDTPAFHSDVIAYPAVTVIAREESGPTKVAHRPAIDPDALTALADALRGEESPASGAVQSVGAVARGAEPWILDSFDALAVVRRLEAAFPTLEETGCSVGIGVATGADRVFVGPYDALPVEPDRKLPLVTTRDIRSGRVEWGGQGVINPFRDDGGLVDLQHYPLLAAYLGSHEGIVRRRNVARRNPGGWYRTIDRIYPALTTTPKLLIPDIKGEPNIVFEEGRYYPHHNLYYITSAEWDLHALQAVLLSGIARLFISTYSTRMRGGYLRYQAQYLRRIRLPRWQDISAHARKALAKAAASGDLAACNDVVCDLYGLTPAERAAVIG
jgi:hypothetical protein